MCLALLVSLIFVRVGGLGRRVCLACTFGKSFALINYVSSFAVFRLDWPNGLRGSALLHGLPHSAWECCRRGLDNAPQSRVGQGAAVAGRDDDWCER